MASKKKSSKKAAAPGKTAAKATTARKAPARAVAAEGPAKATAARKARAPAEASTAAKAALDLRTFKKMLMERFPFDRNGYFKAPDRDTFLAFVSGKRRLQLGAFNVIPIEDTERHFRASAIMDAPVTDEIVHVTEPGKYFDHVFWNDHESGLYSIDCIEDYEEEIDMEEYARWSKERRVRSMPFFATKLASNLQEFLDGIRTMSREEFYDKHR